MNKEGKIWVTGRGGLMASEIARLATDSAIYSSRQECDIADINSVESFISSHNNIRAIINCAADRNAEKIEEDEHAARSVTIDGPLNLAKIANKLSIPLIHFSSDYVFGDTFNKPITEDMDTNPLNVYGKLKAECEQLLMQTAETCIVVRTSWIFSRFGGDFVSTVAKICKQKKHIKVVCDQVGSPTYGSDLAQAILELEAKIQHGTRDILHISNNGICSWYDLAEFIVAELGIEATVEPILSSEFHMKAKRPSYSVLWCRKALDTYGINMRHYRTALIECCRLMKNNI